MSYLTGSYQDLINGLIEEKSKLEQQLAESYAKITEMKCCGNCSKYRTVNTGSLFTGCAINGENRLHSEKCDEWELRK
jgi:hypothetical protein